MPETEGMPAPTPSTFRGIIGHIDEFKPENEPFPSYMEHVQLFFTANGVGTDKQVPVFLSVVGAKTYTLLRNLVAPTPPKDKTIEEIEEILKGHYEPKPLVIAERFHFHKRSQAVGESIADYVAELRRLTTHCGYAAGQLEEALRDRLVCGLRNVSTQKKLLTEADLTLAKAIKIAQGMEAADKMLKL